jgi:5-(carboxyamino)imidazole ribonucleotide synthase
VAGNISQKIGVLGGGQLGKMLYQSASRFGISMCIMDKDKTYPAGTVCPYFTEGDIISYKDVLAFGMDQDIVTIEIENVSTDALHELQALGKKVFPQPEILDIIKDKGRQKEYYRINGFSTSAFELYKDASDIKKAVIDGVLPYPFVQKSRTEGYDGRGVQIVRNENDLENLLDTASVVENLVQFKKEIAVIVARNTSGEVAAFPVVDMDFHPTANLVEFLICPSDLDKTIQESAQNLAKTLAESLGIVGLLAVEMFVDTNDKLLINEIAPRPHNSGHHTIDACVTSQYEQHIRSILDLPLGDTSLTQSAVMINLLGEPHYSGNVKYEGLEEILKLSGVYPHLYGKKETRPFRKMGHVTITDTDLKSAMNKARFVKQTLKVIS